ncbi:MAG: hypothetical protein ACTSVI_13445 [Promethearchaeota archaeon]
MKERVARILMRIAFMTSGILLFAGSIFLLVSGLRIPNFFIEYELDGETFEFDFTLIIDFVLLFMGIALISFAIKLSTLPPNVINSFPISRFVAGSMLFFLSIASLAVYGISYGHLNEQGTWLVLGGGSLFFPTGLIPMILGIGLLVFCAFSFMKIKFDREGDKLTISELRFPRAMITEIDMKDIETIELSNRYTGPKYIWSVILMISIVYLYIDGFSFLLNTVATEGGVITGIAYLLSATVQLIALLLLLFNSQYMLRIISKDKIYELQFYPVTWKFLKRTNLNFMLFPSEKKKYNGISMDKIRQRSDFKKLLTGIFFVFIGIVSRIYYMYAGEIYRFGLFIAGIILIVEGIKADITITSKGLEVIDYPDNEDIQLADKGWFYTRQMYFRNLEKNAGNKPAPILDHLSNIQPTKLTIVEHATLDTIMFLIGMQIFPILFLYPSSAIASNLTNAFMTQFILSGLIITLIILLIMNPTRVVKVKLGDRNCQVAVNMIQDERISFRKIPRLILLKFKNFFMKYQTCWETYKKVMIARALELTIACVLGILAGFAIYLS